MVKMNFPQFNFSPNSLVSMHQFSTATKVVGSLPHNITFIPATSTQHYQNSPSHVSFPNNFHVTSTIINQSHYHNTHSAVPASNQIVTSDSVNSTATITNSTAAQTSWTDGANRMTSNAQKLNLPTFTPQTQSSLSQAVQRASVLPKVVMKSVATMTDSITSFHSHKKKNSQKFDINENSNDSLKSSSTDNWFQRSTYSNSCTNINLKRNASAMAEYLRRLQNTDVPPNIEDFIKKHNIKTDFSKIDSLHVKKSCDESNKEIPEIRMSTAIDGSLLYCCPECQMAYSQKELLDRHLSVHRSERKFECNICGIYLKRKEHLDQHKLGHSEDRPFVCDICCKGFKRNEHLRRHIVIHSGDKSHVCPQCGKAFSRKDHLNKHLHIHINKQGKQEVSEPPSPLLQVTQNHKT